MLLTCSVGESMISCYRIPFCYCECLNVLHVCVQCSVTCGNGTRERQVMCSTPDNAIGICMDTKPESIKSCLLAPCPSECPLRPIQLLRIHSFKTKITLFLNSLLISRWERELPHPVALQSRPRVSSAQDLLK